MKMKMAFWPMALLVGIECKLNNTVIRFPLSIFSEVIAAPIIMVGNDNGTRMYFFLP
jgi:hypothetical protein